MVVVGGTGVGKTVTISDVLNQGLPSDYIPQCTTFSAKTSVHQTQQLIENAMIKRY